MRSALSPELRFRSSVASAVPLTPLSRKMIGEKEFGMMKRGVILINVSRGAILAEPDLMTLIRSGHIAGATLDVFRHEPLPAQHPFWNEPRIALTPHISALTMRQDAVRQIVAKIDALERGQPVDDLVDRQRGY